MRSHFGQIQMSVCGNVSKHTHNYLKLPESTDINIVTKLTQSSVRKDSK